jgi:beta-phosphoglucomutase-like phosphatase (HAD superfamily)
VDSPKPDAASYLFALEQLGEDADTVVAIEDNEGGVAAASAAGVRCVAFPNENTVDGDFAAATNTVESLDAEQLVGLVG